MNRPFAVLFTLLFSSSLAVAQLEQVEVNYARIQAAAEEQPQTITFVQKDSGWVEDYSKLAQIILIRHGEPALDKGGSRTRKEAEQFVRAYDSVGIYTPAFVPLILQPGELAVINTSSIPRAVSTAQQVFQGPEEQKPDARFREFERKILSFPNVRLPLKMWLNSSRILWLFGTNRKGIESFRQAKTRAKEDAVWLEADALKNGKTLLVSHGLLNHFLVKYLKKQGWTEVYDGGKGYLSQKMLVKYQP